MGMNATQIRGALGREFASLEFARAEFPMLTTWGVRDESVSVHSLGFNDWRSACKSDPLREKDRRVNRTHRIGVNGGGSSTRLIHRTLVTAEFADFSVQLYCLSFKVFDLSCQSTCMLLSRLLEIIRMQGTQSVQFVLGTLFQLV